MKIHGRGNEKFAEINTVIDEDTDLIALTDSAFRAIESHDIDKINEVFCGIDLSRKIFLDLFDDEETFKKKSKRIKHLFVKSLEMGMMRAKNKQDFFIANGMSVVMIWCISLIFSKDKEQDYIEQKISDARRKYKIQRII